MENFTRAGLDAVRYTKTSGIIPQHSFHSDSNTWGKLGDIQTYLYKLCMLIVSANKEFYKVLCLDQSSSSFISYLSVKLFVKTT